MAILGYGIGFFAITVGLAAIYLYWCAHRDRHSADREEYNVGLLLATILTCMALVMTIAAIALAN